MFTWWHEETLKSVFLFYYRALDHWWGMLDILFFWHPKEALDLLTVKLLWTSTDIYNIPSQTFR